MNYALRFAFILFLIIPSFSLSEVTFNSLTANSTIADFNTECVYENEVGDVMGARFSHVNSGFVLDFLRIQSVPQAFMWVNSHPVSDQGEPHTLEHLLLGKGNKGRYVASLEEMRLGNSSAFTQQLRTCYHFHTSAGSDVFFELFDAKLDAMLHPTFSDEEIRREVMNMGITEGQVKGTLRLEEKGTVYNEMITSFERTWGNLYFELGKIMFGQSHPSSYSAGGFPAEIREMEADDIRKFHQTTHHLNNMGAVVTLPNDMPIEESLRQFSDILKKIEPDVKIATHPDDGLYDIPPYDPAPEGTMRQVSFPHQNENEPGVMVFGWPAQLELNLLDKYMFDLFTYILSRGQTSNLYRNFIDSQHREIDIGATSIYGWVSDEKGNPFYISVNNVDRTSANTEMMKSVADLILKEIAYIADMKDGSEELKKFNERIISRISQNKRELRDFLNSPPRFGYRGSGANWMEHLNRLHKEGGEKRSLSMNEVIAKSIEFATTEENIWRRYIEEWQLLSTLPFGVVTTPDPQYLSQTEIDRDIRITEYLSGLMEWYETDSEEAALSEYKKIYDEKTDVIKKKASEIEMPVFLDNPPMSLDDQLDYHVETLPGGGDMVISQFDNITGGTTGLAFDLYGVPESMLMYLSALPIFMTEIGVVKDGDKLSYENMQESLKREILRLKAAFTTNTRTERIELVVSGSGSNLNESIDALGWMESILINPDMSEENLPRIRDAIDMRLSALRNRTKGSEESWVNNPVDAFWKQSNPLYLSTSCFYTQAHALQRIKWQLTKAPESLENEKFTRFMYELAELPDEMNADELSRVIADLQNEDKSGKLFKRGKIGYNLKKMNDESLEIAEKALADLQHNLGEIPDENLNADWEYLCNSMMDDLAVEPSEVLKAEMNLLNHIRGQQNIRGYMISSESASNQIKPELDKIVSQFNNDQFHRFNYGSTPRIADRMNDRYADMERPVYVGLLNENTRAGIHINSAESASYYDFDEETLLNFMAARLYGGGGAHSMFMKTWSAGLAYSNGLRSNEFTGRLRYYAERCPDLSQTMQFVVDELKNAPFDPSLAGYAVAQAFTSVRSGNRYDSRGIAMAADLADGLTPEKVSRFRGKVIELGKRENIYDDLHERMISTYGQVLPGYGPSGSESNNANYFLIGPESQLQPYQDYLNSVEDDAILYRLYPRDFWLVDRANR